MSAEIMWEATGILHDDGTKEAHIYPSEGDVMIHIPHSGCLCNPTLTPWMSPQGHLHSLYEHPVTQEVSVTDDISSG